MKLVTTASKHRLTLILLQRRVASAFECVVLGSDRQWTSFQPKLACMYDFSKKEIDAGRGDEPFVFVDAFDAIVVNLDPNYYRALYNGKPLFAAEMYNWPDTTLSYPEGNFLHRQPYLNSGCFIATARDICALLTKNQFRHYTNDQLYWAQVYVKNPSGFELDFDSRLCACLIAYLKDPHALRKDGSDFVFLNTFRNPGILHFNGPARIKRRMWFWYGYLMLQAMRTGARRVAKIF
ncbi:MAG: hypothetical protein FJ119_11500 [Deltaproteobacteria bacterium]|nr:hypothetical protein [Deltaproteobacteria bacterium]